MNFQWPKAVPRFLNNARFFPVGSDCLMVAADKYRLFISVTTGEVQKVPDGIEPPGGENFTVEGRAVVGPHADEEYALSFRWVVPVRDVGNNITICREDPDVWKAVKYIYDETSGLNSSDDWDWEDAHFNFSGAGAGDAVDVLVQGLNDPDAEVQRMAAVALEDLLRHADHGCYSLGSCGKLLQAGQRLERASQDSNVPKEVRREFQLTAGTFRVMRQWLERPFTQAKGGRPVEQPRWVRFVSFPRRYPHR